jgi:hypothetical protein
MKNVLGLLLGGDFSSAHVRSIFSIVTSIHFAQEFLSISSLHIEISCFHGFDLNSHASGSGSSLEHLFLAKESTSISCCFLLELWFYNSFSVCSTGVSF